MDIKNTNSKRIVKNTIVLYVRSLIVMLVALYTSRVILKSLGIEDYGLYNVVGGVIGLFSFLRTSMEKCTQRFLNFEMAHPTGRIKDVFRVSFTIHIIIAVIAFVLLETLGIWFLNTYIQIPFGREFAANCIFQVTVFSLLLTILTIPFSASIISHEKMTFFALISIADSILNLSIAFIIQYSTFDKLILYGVLLLFVNIFNFIVYLYHCKKTFEEVCTKILWDKNIVKQLISYIGWTLFGHTCIIGTNQGNIILVNMFHGVGVNAAMAIASQVNRAILNLTNNFQTAFNPQITKSYAKGDYQYLYNLIIYTTKISYFLLLIVSLPLMLNIDFILKLWLTEVPHYSNIFCIYMIISGVLQAMTSPLNFCVMATGKIKYFQIYTGITFLCDLLILYTLFSLGAPPITAMYVKCLIMFIVCIIRLSFAKRQIPILTYLNYFIKVLIPLSLTTILSVGVSLLLMMFVDSVFMHLISIIMISITTLLLVYLVGLDKEERNMLFKYIKVKK